MAEESDALVGRTLGELVLREFLDEGGSADYTQAGGAITSPDPIVMP